MAPPVNTTLYSRVPPGFRFHPTDEELVNYYLRKKVALEKFELDVIREVDLNKLEPWDLHERCKIDNTQTEWYFFSHKDKKYPTGSRTNRATAAGFWKATGRDKAVYSNCKRIGMRKTLVFYRGRAPHGMKTDWIMHEYRMDESENATKGFNEEGWVICRVFEKRNHQRKGQENDSFGIEEEEEAGCLQKLEACENPQEHSARSRPAITCKQEADFEECVLSQSTFLQLPPLESPKMSSNQPCFNPSIDPDKALVENGKRTEFSQQLYSLELSGIAYSKSFVSDDSFTDYADSRQLTEWGMIESIIPKDMGYNAEISFNGDMHYPVTHKQQHLEYPTSYEIDLWNFTR